VTEPDARPSSFETQEADVLKNLIAACLMAFTLAAPVLAQAPAPGPTPPGQGGGGVIGTPKEGSTAQPAANAIPLLYVILVVVGVTGAILYVLYRRRRGG
jgi:hypothetical protein